MPTPFEDPEIQAQLEDVELTWDAHKRRGKKKKSGSGASGIGPFPIIVLAITTGVFIFYFFFKGASSDARNRPSQVAQTAVEPREPIQPTKTLPSHGSWPSGETMEPATTTKAPDSLPRFETTSIAEEVNSRPDLDLENPELPNTVRVLPRPPEVIEPLPKPVVIVEKTRPMVQPLPAPVAPAAPEPVVEEPEPEPVIVATRQPLPDRPVLPAPVSRPPSNPSTVVLPQPTTRPAPVTPAIRPRVIVGGGSGRPVARVEPVPPTSRPPAPEPATPDPWRDRADTPSATSVPPQRIAGNTTFRKVSQSADGTASYLATMRVPRTAYQNFARLRNRAVAPGQWANVSYTEAEQFANWLTQIHRANREIRFDEHYRLPTSSEDPSGVWQLSANNRTSREKRQFKLVLVREARRIQL